MALPAAHLLAIPPGDVVGRPRNDFVAETEASLLGAAAVATLIAMALNRE